MDARATIALSSNVLVREAQRRKITPRDFPVLAPAHAVRLPIPLHGSHRAPCRFLGAVTVWMFYPYPHAVIAWKPVATPGKPLIFTCPFRAVPAVSILLEMAFPAASGLARDCVKLVTKDVLSV
ncbi:hypothetical protein P3T23_004548 [Paraburkholderia sp. GAS448]|uniref:hypothetical protein n=1 Tax=Paraburkholderia sp. GAS448 TaxID=3035136 RepID=UPI003D1E1423